MSRITPETASRYIQSFNKSFGEAHLYLACHAALPIALTPDLLYLLWKNFQCDINGQQLNIPWIAVADLLLSSLCHEVGHELYEMDLPIRNILLNNLQKNHNFGKTRINNISNFLLEYIKPQLSSTDQDIQDLAQTQRLTALAYLNPNQVAQEIAIAFTKTNQKKTTELLRITSLVETLAEPLSEYEDLLLYSRGMVNLMRGKVEDAKIQFLELIGQEPEVIVSGVNLPIPEQIKANLSIIGNLPNKSLPIIGGGISALLITILGNFGFQYLLLNFLKQPAQNSTPTPQQTITTSLEITPNIISTSTPSPDALASQEATPIISATPTSKPSVTPSPLVALSQPIIPIPRASNLTLTPTPSASNITPSPSNINPSVTPTPFPTTTTSPIQTAINNPIIPIPRTPNISKTNPSGTSTPSTSNTIQYPSPSSTRPSITPTPLPTVTTSPLATINKPIIPTSRTEQLNSTPSLACPYFPLCGEEPNISNVNPSVTSTPSGSTITQLSSPSTQQTSSTTQSETQLAQLQDWRFSPEIAQLEFTLSAASQPKVFFLSQPQRLVIDLPGTRLAVVPAQQNYSGAIQRIRLSQISRNTTRIVLDIAPETPINPSQVLLQPTSPTSWVLRPFANLTNNIAPGIYIPQPANNIPQEIYTPIPSD